jgi:hypothetical protein
MSKHTTITQPAELTEADFCAWIGQAFPGAILEYHRGFLAVDANSPLRGDLGRRTRELSLLARRARWASDAGLVHLVQRRNGPADFSYLAVARPRRNDAKAVAITEEDVA